MDKENRAEAIARFCAAIGNLSVELIEGGVGPIELSAQLRIEAGKIERRAPRPAMDATEQELTDLVRRCHEFVNSLQVAGLDERTIATALVHVAAERNVRLHGVTVTATWLRSMANLLEQQGEAFEITARSH